MEEINLHIKQLNTKLQLLLKQHSSVLTAHEQQKKATVLLQQKNEEQQAVITLLQQQQLILKASIDTMDEKEKKELEQKINNYVRSIDTCISILSHNR